MRTRTGSLRSSAPYEADPDLDKISSKSPIGEAMYGRKVGETVEARTPGGVLRYKILSINRPPE